MAFQFPTNPSTNQVYSLGGTSWTYNGIGWKKNTSVATGTYSKPVTGIPASDLSTSVQNILSNAVSGSQIIPQINGIDSIAYRADGAITGITGVGWSSSVTYDNTTGKITSYSETVNGVTVTKTITYDGSGSIVSYK